MTEALLMLLLVLVVVLLQRSQGTPFVPNRPLNRVIVVVAVLSIAPIAFIFEETFTRITIVVLEIVLIGSALVLRKRYF